MGKKGKFADGFPSGLAVWTKMGTFPWWPAVIINRSIAERSLEEGDTLPPASANNRTVEFFNDDKRVGVIDCKFLQEYTAGMHNVRRAGKDLDDVLVACAEASDYILEHGKKGQQKALEECDYALPKRKGEKMKKKGKGHGDRKKKRGLAGKSPVTVPRGSVTSKVANKMGKKSEEVELAGPSRDGHRRSRSRGGSSDADGNLPAKRRKGETRLKNSRREPETDEIEPVADVVSKDATKKNVETRIVAANGGKSKALTVLNGALSTFCSVHRASELGDGDARLAAQVKIRIEVTGASLPPLALEQGLTLKELMGEIPLKAIETAVTGRAEKNDLGPAKEGSNPDGNKMMTIDGAKGSTLQANEHNSGLKIDLARSPVRSASDKTSDKMGANPNGEKSSDKLVEVESEEDARGQAAAGTPVSELPVPKKHEKAPKWANLDKEEALDLFENLVRDFLKANPEVGDDSMGDGLAGVLEGAVSAIHGDDKEKYFKQTEQIEVVFKLAEKKGGEEHENVAEFVKTQNSKHVVRGLKE